jgi:chromosome segregation ATPase
MGFWSKLFGFDKRWAVMEQKLLDQAKHHHKYMAQLDTKLEIMAQDVVGHLHTVPNENKINLLENQLIDLTSRFIELKSSMELNTHEIDAISARVRELKERHDKLSDNVNYEISETYKRDERQVKDIKNKIDINAAGVMIDSAHQSIESAREFSLRAIEKTYKDIAALEIQIAAIELEEKKHHHPNEVADVAATNTSRNSLGKGYGKLDVYDE